MKYCRDAWEFRRSLAPSDEATLEQWYARKILAPWDTRLKASLGRAEVARKELEEARVALKDAEEEFASIDDSNDEDTMAVEKQLSSTKPSKKRDHACVDLNNDKSSGAGWKSRHVSDVFPKKVLVEGSKRHEVNGVYQFDGFDDRGYPTYAKDCGCELYKIKHHRDFLAGWIINCERKESEERSFGLVYHLTCSSVCPFFSTDDSWEDPVPWLFTTSGWDSFIGDNNTALKVRRL